MKKNYLDNVLIKLKRAYSKDETVAALDRKLREARLEIGVLDSEKAELEYKLSKYKQLENNYNQAIAASKNQIDKIRELKAENRFLIGENEDLRNKF